MAKIKKGINGRRKGHSFERDQAKAWGNWWGDVKLFARTPVSGGWKIAGDIACTDNDFPFVLEMKKRESWNFGMLWSADCEIYKWLHQVVSDKTKKAPAWKIPMVVFTKNHDDIYCMMNTSEFLSMQDYIGNSCMSKMRFKLVNTDIDIMIFRQKEFFGVITG